MLTTSNVRTTIDFDYSSEEAVPGLTIGGSVTCQSNGTVESLTVSKFGGGRLGARFVLRFTDGVLDVQGNGLDASRFGDLVRLCGHLLDEVSSGSYPSSAPSAESGGDSVASDGVEVPTDGGDAA